MDDLRQYIFSVIAAAVVCSVMVHIRSGTGQQNGLIRLLCGLFLSLTVIRPIADIRIEELSEYSLNYRNEALEAVSAGEDFARESLDQIIKRETEAYILDKAASYGADISVEIVLDPDLVPAEAYIQGTISPYARSQMQKILSEDIGIAKEYQIWIQ